MQECVPCQEDSLAAMKVGFSAAHLSFLAVSAVGGVYERWPRAGAAD